MFVVPIKAEPLIQQKPLTRTILSIFKGIMKIKKKSKQNNDKNDKYNVMLQLKP